MTSPYGTNWTLQTVDVGIPEGDLAEGLLHINYLNSMYVVGGKQGIILTSPDGVTWTKRAFSEDTSWFFDSYYEGGKYYFPGRRGNLWSTTDWVTWTGIDTGASDDINSIETNGSLYFVVGRDGEIFTSNNLTTWTNGKQGFTENFAAAAYGG